MNRENEKTNPENIQTENVSEEILQNLKDAGCDETTIGCYIGLLRLRPGSGESSEKTPALSAR